MNTKTTRILSVVLALVLCFGLMATAAFAADKESTAAPIDLQVYGVGARDLSERLVSREKRNQLAAKVRGLLGKKENFAGKNR